MAVTEAPREVVVLDTSALLYWTLAPERLSRAAADCLGSAEEKLVLSVSLWEIALKNRRGALELPCSVREYMERLGKVQDLQIRLLDAGLAVAGALLDWAHRDPVDRWIAALARSVKAPLVSSDRHLREFYHDTVW